VRHVGGQFRGQRLSAGGEGGECRPLDVLEPGRHVVREPGLGQELHGFAAFDDGDRSGARREDHGYQLGRKHEHGASHAQRADQRAALVEGIIELGNSKPANARPGGEVDRRRVGRVQRDQIADQPGDVGGA
jgi:hypothetical protein